MKIGVFFEYIFTGTHCESHFAHLCLFVMLLCLFYSFIKGVKEQLDAKDEEERRKHNMLQVERFRQQQIKKNEGKTPKDSAMADDTAKGKKDFTKLQQEQMLKTILIEQLSLEESNLSNYKFDKDRPELNAVVHTKEDVENPIIRLDAVVDYSAHQLYETLITTDTISQWFSDRCLVSRLVEQLPSGTEIYVLILTFPQPINQLTIYYKRFLKKDEASNIYKIIFSSKGLENYQPPPTFIKQILNDSKIRLQNETSHRASFSQFGIVLRPSGLQNGGGATVETSSQKCLTKIFYLQQVDFGGYLLPTQSQVQLLSNFMFEFVEQACERSVNLQANSASNTTTYSVSNTSMLRQ